MSRALPSALRVLATIVAVAALSACGGSSSTATTSATTATTANSTALTWAGSVCSALATWKTDIVAAGTAVKANPTKAGVERALADAKAATNTLKTRLKALGTPTTSASSEAQTALQQLKGQLQNDIAVIERTINSGASGGGQAASTIETGIATMRSQLAATGKELRSLPSGDLEQAFNDAPACASLEASSPS